MIDEQHRHGLKVFCENGRFKLEQIERLLEAAQPSADSIEHQLLELSNLIDNLRYYLYTSREYHD